MDEETRYAFLIENGADMDWRKKADPKMFYVKRRVVSDDSHEEQILGMAVTNNAARGLLNELMKDYDRVCEDDGFPTESYTLKT